MACSTSNQVEFIDALIDAYEASGRYAEAEKESVYALRVEEAAYGRNSIKLLDRLDKLARWYEASRRYTSERNTYERALGILAKSAPENDLRRVAPLRGIARSFRLEAFYGIEGADNGAALSTPAQPARRCSPTARSSAVARARSRRRSPSSMPTQPVDRTAARRSAHRSRRLVPGRPTRCAAPTTAYAEAWKALATVSNTKMLEKPRVLAYRPSISSVDRSQLDPAEAEVKPWSCISRSIATAASTM